jgi:hypothetical protein
MEAMNESSLVYREYQALPDSIRALYSFQQYQWLSDYEKARLIQSETEPDFYDD